MSSGGLFLVDALADEPFRGNPAAVVLLEAERPDEWLQALAHVLWEQELLATEMQARFQTPAGELAASFDEG